MATPIPPILKGRLKMPEYSTRIIRHWTEEGQCDGCGFPLEVGETAFLVNDGEGFFGSRGCRSRWAAFVADREADVAFSHLAR